MSKNLNLFFFFCAISMCAHAQWSQQDSLKLRRLLDGDGEIRLNPNAVNQIDFGSFVGEPIMSDKSPALQYNTTLPTPVEARKYRLTLMPYTPWTKFNYDPIYQKKIKVKEGTWKGDTLSYLMMHLTTHHGNWAKKRTEGGFRKSLEEIEATGLRYNPIGERANGMAVGVWEVRPTSGRIGVSSGKISIGGFDFMKPFTQEFWNRTGRKRRERTLELLKNYGDSITVNQK